MTLETMASTFTFADGRTINRLGFGTMRLTGQPRNFGPYDDWEAGLAVIRAARNEGVELFDTARAYGPGHAERLLGEAIAPDDNGAFIVTKGGMTKTGIGSAFINPDARPEQLEREINASLTDLRREQIDLYFLHRPDPNVPFEDQVGALEKARQSGKIARIGLSNVSLDHIRRAQAVTRIDAIQNRYNSRDGGDEAVLDYAMDQGMAFLPWGPLGAHPMQSGSPLANQDRTIDGMTPIQSALFALLARSPNIIPIPGTTSRAHAVDNARTLRIAKQVGLA